MHDQKQSKRSYIPPNRRRTADAPTSKKLIMDDEHFPALSSNASKSIQPIGIGSFAKIVQLETTPVVETKTMETQDTPRFQSKVGRQIEENRIQGLWNRLIREDVQPRIWDDPNYDRYIHDYQVKYEQSFNQEDYSDTHSEEDDEQEETDEDE